MRIVLNLLLIIAATSLNIFVDDKTSLLKDEDNRFRIIHGVNVVYKQFPYYPFASQFNQNDSLVDQDFQNLQKWGINSIRLFISWQGFQPLQGKYNYTYLQELKKIIQRAQSYSISILLDAHQDLYSKRYCGQGFPVWLTQVHSFPSPFKIELRKDAEGNPLKEDCMKIPFFKYYATKDVNQFQNDFFENKNGMNDKFVKMWTLVASFFESQNNIIGYDLINQPSGANAWNNIYNLISPGINNNKYLLPFYKKLSKQIRKIDNKKLIFFQPSVADYFGGFYNNPGGAQFSKKDIMSYHTYCPFKNDHAQPTSDIKCSIIDTIYMSLRASNIKKLKIGGVMTQFGSVPQSVAGINQINRVLRLAEDKHQSWYYWQYKYNSDSTCSTSPPWQHSFYYPNGTLQIKKIKTLSYPYAYAICGDSFKQSHSPSSYYLNYIPKKCLNNKKTQIFINQQLYFSKGYHIHFNPSCKDCRIKLIKPSYYQVIIPDEYLNFPMEVGVIGFI